jgi:hypothetical protein
MKEGSVLSSQSAREWRANVKAQVVAPPLLLNSAFASHWHAGCTSPRYHEDAASSSSYPMTADY